MLKYTLMQEPPSLIKPSLEELIERTNASLRFQEEMKTWKREFNEAETNFLANVNTPDRLATVIVTTMMEEATSTFLFPSPLDAIRTMSGLLVSLYQYGEIVLEEW